MLRRVGDFEGHADLRVEAINAIGSKVCFGVEGKPIITGAQDGFNEKEWLYPPVVISPCLRELTPTLIKILTLKSNMNAVCRSASRYVEDMR